MSPFRTWMSHPLEKIHAKFEFGGGGKTHYEMVFSNEQSEVLFGHSRL